MMDENVLIIDIGSSTSRALITNFKKKDNKSDIIAYCEKTTVGFSSGLVDNVQYLSRVLSSIVNEITNVSNKEIKKIFVVFSSIEENYLSSKAKLFLPTEINHSSVDKKKVFDLALLKLKDKMSNIMCIIDNSDIIFKTRVGLNEISSSIIGYSSFTKTAKIIKEIFLSLGYNDVYFLPPLFCLSDSIFTNKNTENSGIILNIGAKISSIISIKKNELYSFGNINIAGDSITDDLVYFLKRSKRICEQIKCEKVNIYLPNSQSKNADDYIELVRYGSQGPIKILSSEITKILEPRAAEILLNLKKFLLNDKRENYDIPIIITGCASYMKGFVELGTEIFAQKCRLGFPFINNSVDRKFIEPRYSTILGAYNLIKYNSLSYIKNTLIIKREI